MAVDGWHRLVVRGPRNSVRELRQQLSLKVRRTAPGLEPWDEVVPFSFERLYQLAPKSARLGRYPPIDPYYISVWPIRGLPDGQAETRYQMHTRSLELLPFVRALSKAFPELEFQLVSDFDGVEFLSYLVRGGRVQKWVLPDEAKDAIWEQVRQKLGLKKEKMYENLDAYDYAEELMREEALDHWDRERGIVRRRPREWWNRPAAHDLEEARLILLAQFQEAAKAQDRERSRGKSTKTKGTSKRKRRGRA